MRKVIRQSCPNSLANVAVQEHEAARVRVAGGQGVAKVFKGYKGDAVVDALREMFNEKCSYCESSMGHVSPPDIEHFRPKGAFSDPSGALIKPGYYWLGAEWSNLLLSCIDCNRKRRHRRKGSSGDATGKGNLFPLADEGRRARQPGQEKAETPLLLNPCLDNVEDLFECGVDGWIGPSAGAQGLDLARVKETIEVIGLNRPMLRESREAKFRRVQAAIERYRNALDGYGQAAAQEEGVVPEELLGTLKHQVRMECDEIRALLDEKQDYSAVARAYVSRECPELCRYLGLG